MSNDCWLFVLLLMSNCFKKQFATTYDDNDPDTHFDPKLDNYVSEFFDEQQPSSIAKVLDHGQDGPLQQTPTLINTGVLEPYSNGEDENLEGLELMPDFLLLERRLTNITKDSGDTVRLRCEFRGNPTPDISWYKNEAPLELEKGKIDVKQYGLGQGRVGSRLKIVDLDIHDTGYYKCDAVSGDRREETSGILMVKAGRMPSQSLIPIFPPPYPHFPALGGRLPEFSNNEMGFCQIYRGVACSQLIANRTVYVPPKITLNQMEENLATLFTFLASNKEMNKECRKFVVPFYCFTFLPPCDDSTPYPTPRKVCREECESLESSTCKKEMLAVREQSVISQRELLPACSDLPNQQDRGSKEGQGNCINLNIPKIVIIDQADQTCYVEQGETYRGSVSHTISSIPCQPWSHIADYEDLAGSQNYCRNPGGLESQPWCFISDPHIKRQICPIPKCPDYSWLYILLPSLTTAILLLVLLIIWCKKQRRKNTMTKLSPQGPTAQLIPTHQASQILHSQQQIEMQKFLPRIPACVLQVDPKTLRYLHELGEGVFGKVYRGELSYSDPTGTNAIQPVAIKTLREAASPATQQEFGRELETVAALQHPNVVCLVAICIREEPLCMLFEYMFQCDLHEYLLVHSPHSDVSARTEDGTPHILELPDFLVISIQIAAGMEYLSNKRYVHRDLAARNCLVSADTSLSPASQSCLPNNVNSLSTINDLVVKISDLGLSRNSCASDYFRIRNTLLPVRWMAPESLLYGTFTTESDVWSFGVLLWEIFSYGIQPYFNYDNKEVIDLICSHQLLHRPEYCPSYVFSIMNDSWHDTASHRPSFKEIYNRLCSVQTLHERAFSISHSVLTHNSSHPSSTGPSNKTLSTNLSGGTIGTSTPNGNHSLGGPCIPMRHSSQQTLRPFCHATNFASAKMVTGHRSHHCEQV